MRFLRSAICIMLVLGTLLLCSCSGRKKVTVIQSNDKKPDEKKKVQTNESASLGHDYSEDIKVSFSDDALTLKNPTDEYEIPYGKIEEYTYMTEWDFLHDKLMDGTDTDCELYGHMKTDGDEEYIICIYKTTPVFIAVYFGGMQYVFNLDSATATRECYSKLREKVG